MLPSHMQWHPTRDQDRQLWARREQVGDRRCCGHHLFEVVKQQQEAFGAHVALQPGLQGLIGGVAQSKMLSDGRDHQMRIADGGQIDEDKAVREIGQCSVSRALQCQARLTDTAGAGEREQAHVQAA